MDTGYSSNSESDSDDHRFDYAERLEANAHLLRNLMEQLWCVGNPTVLNQTVVPTIELDGTILSGFGNGLESLKGAMIILLTAFPSLDFVIEREQAFGDVMVMDVIFIGCNTGYLMALPPTNRCIQMEATFTARIAHEKIVALTGNWCVEDLLNQLGYPSDSAWRDAGSTSEWDDTADAA